MNITMKHEPYPKKDMVVVYKILSYSSKVNWFKRILSLIVLALWVSCVIRCEAARLTCSTALSCCGDVSDDCVGKPASPGHGVCSWVQFGGYISENMGVPLPQPVDLVVFTQPGWQAQGLPVEQGAVAKAERN